MRIRQLYIAALLLVLTPIEVSARDGKAIWDSRCEQCHGDPDKFANKYLWNVEGVLQGQHHIDNLSLFMRNHYIPDHEIETVRDMLLILANSASRYTTECAECHGDAGDYVARSFRVGERSITIIESGQDVGEFLQNHQELGPEDVTFYLRLFSRIDGKPISLSLPLPLPLPGF